YPPYRDDRAADVLEQEQVPARPKHAVRLGERLPRVRNDGQGEGEHHRVELVVGTGQGLRVAKLKVHRETNLHSSPTGDRQHGWTEVDAREQHVARVEREVSPGPD